MLVLSFAKPKRAMPIEDWKSISADGAPPGVYVPNMEEEDRLRWKAKVVGSKSGNFQIEIRSEKPRSNIVVVVNGKMPTAEQTHIYGSGDYVRTIPRHENHPNEVKMSANGPMYFDPLTWVELVDAVLEARLILSLLDDPTTRAAALKKTRAGLNPLEG